MFAAGTLGIIEKWRGGRRIVDTYSLLNEDRAFAHAEQLSKSVANGCVEVWYRPLRVGAPDVLKTRYRDGIQERI